jgi:regulator of cell morphogenesis and NO signaling
MENILNVTLLEPRLKHPTIFTRFDALQEGESLTIHNDHDPKPLYYQLLGERGNTFTWEYLEHGPKLWKVRISKYISGIHDETLGEIAAKDLRKAAIFEKYGLDFCCGGKKTVKEACADKGLDVTKIEHELQLTDKNVNTRPIPYNEWKLDFLADYIINTHHYYIRKSLPEIRSYAAKVAQVHGDRHPELQTIHMLVEKLHTDLSAHLEKEEKILFPYIKELVATPESARLSQSSNFGIQHPIADMEREHETAAEILAGIRSLSNNYTLPADACASYGLLYRMLDEFENDLHLHVHLENNILFPKALLLEQNRFTNAGNASCNLK